MRNQHGKTPPTAAARRHNLLASLLLSAGLLLTVGLFAGCSPTDEDQWTKQRPPVVPVTGTVLYQGTPVEGASVTMMNADTSTGGSGLTDAEGRFRLTTFKDGDGAAPGMQQVIIRKVEIIDRRQPGVDYSTTSEPAPPPEERWLIPERYSRYNTSGLKAEVTVGAKNDFTFELQ